MAGSHPDPDTSYETQHGSLDVNLQETGNKDPECIPELDTDPK